MRKLFLHIGCGKTGSSALQIWLAQNADRLERSGVFYPRPNKKKLDNYAITSGNAGALISKLNSVHDAEELLISNLKSCENNILYSSEGFQNLDESQIVCLNSVAKKLELEIHIIAYMRDVYNYTYSSYMQLIKRHSYSDTFSRFAYSQKILQQFRVVNFFESFFNNITVLHYDSEKEMGVEKAFCRVIGVKDEMVLPLAPYKVNRSLTLHESQMLCAANLLYKNAFSNNAGEFCTVISDFIISVNPEAETEVYFDEGVVEYFTETMGEQINHINKTFFGSDKLCVLGKSETNYVTELPSLSDETFNFIHGLMKGMTVAFESGLEVKVNPAPALLARDPRVADILRKEAIKVEKSSIEDAYILMSAAKIFRPAGPVITSKVNEYLELLQNTSNDGSN